jgi:outer membrane protein assembly factor BamB
VWVLGAAWLLLCTAERGSGGDWPRFRGPNGTGVATDKDIPIQWTAEDGVLWKVPIPGKGNSSPVIAGNRLFLQSASADGKQRLLLCLDATTGKVLWTRTAPGVPVKALGPNNRNTLASSTPAVEGDRVFALFWDGKDVSLQAYGVQGEQLWKQELGGFKSQHGAGFSPMVYEGKVYVANDQDGSAVLLAFDAATGQKVWEAQRKAFRACYSTPFVRIRPDGAAELLVVSTAGITGYDPKTGTENWHYTWSFTKMPLRTVASPIAANGLVLAHGGDGDGSRHIIAVRMGDKGDVTGTNLVWENRKPRLFPYVPSMLAVGEHFYTVNDDGIAACYGLKTGEEVWSQRLDGGVSASPILVDGKIYVVREDGEVLVYPAATTFKLLAKNSLGEPVMSTPAVANNRLYIRGSEHLFCIGKPSAK